MASQGTSKRAIFLRGFFLALTILFGSALPSPAQAGIPASERQVLLNIYSQTNGAQWTSNTGWNGEAGTECGWYGVSCSADGMHITELRLGANHLAGSLPPLGALTGLVSANFSGPDYPGFDETVDEAYKGQLTGSIPALSELKQLNYFSVHNNKLTGGVPSLTGLTNLEEFNAGYNNLDGNIGSLAGLGKLRYFRVYSNQLTGAIPDLAQTLKLDEFVAAHNRLSGTIPALSHLVWLEIFNVQDNHLEGSIPAIAGLEWLYVFDVSHNRLSGTIPDLSGLIELRSFFVGFNLLTGDVPGTVPRLLKFDGFTGRPAASLCPNLLNRADSPAWDAATGAYWYRDCFDAKVNLNQFGLTGTWYNPATSGQGFMLQGFRDLYSPGQGMLFGGWFTFGQDYGPANGYRQSWYSFQGSVDESVPYAEFDLYTGQGGNFAAPPRIAPSKIGKVLFAMSDCTHATLRYDFDDSLPRNLRVIPLTRLGGNSRCASAGDNGTAPSNLLLSGSWYDKDTSGQGLMIHVDPDSGLLFAAWYTYAKDGKGAQRWFTLQTNQFAPGASAVSNVEILTATDGLFDDPKPVTSQRHLGTADIAFQDCATMTLSYRFDTGENAGEIGTMRLTRLGPAPAGCKLP